MAAQGVSVLTSAEASRTSSAARRAQRRASAAPPESRPTSLSRRVAFWSRSARARAQSASPAGTAAATASSADWARAAASAALFTLAPRSFASSARHRRSVSSRPGHHAPDGNGSRRFSSAPCLSAIRQPNRFPESTAEMYAGGSGSSVCVSYQLRMWPRCFCSRSNVSNVWCRRLAVSRSDKYPKSWAASVDSSSSPLLVGEVRWATTPRGSSWKLSGGSQLSSGPMNSSKNPQVLRATRRISRRSSAVNSTFFSGVGRDTNHATAGASTHRASTGTAAHSAAGWTWATR